MARGAIPLAAGLLIALASTAALADRQGPKWGQGKPGASHSAPGPIMGVGLPGLAAYGIYLWSRRRRRPNRAADD